MGCQLVVVGQVAVVRKANTVRGIDVKRLGFRRLRAAGGRVTHVAHSGISSQALHMALMENVAHESITLAHIQSIVIPGNDSGGVLPAMLQYSQRIVNLLIHRFVTYYSNDTAHNSAQIS